MRGFPTQKQVERIKERYPIGTVIELTADMEDNYNPIPRGMQGEVIGIDDIGTLHMKWQNGSGLGVVVGEDSFKVISKPEPEIAEPIHEMGGMSL
ncbi:DUF4314 domain-containing protein [Anaerotignum sp.]|uniref:DUF4314 domain-containing protein n=1 Tax=Anaerotignum sp. TaxID=2039241 RepID=UPI0028ABAE5D|nr:DUF4314 domain-containing protein [Anaerotignum sp.]